MGLLITLALALLAIVIVWKVLTGIVRTVGLVVVVVVVGVVVLMNGGL
ncbi:MAG: hypothetical protein ACI9TB_002841 [Parasphingorhabdus sp.]|jgi:hypothetical protein|nr:hypothetical protein [Parasphingorhabdus sp.]MBQ0772584.1 hypothetical protein [Sphingomonadales bacterium]|tara:strand:+ start:373 stop:516 length:144 start_codon:yes stop_codon:yes gene_type:complete